jgi:hypothetical protein
MTAVVHILLLAGMAACGVAVVWNLAGAVRHVIDVFAAGRRDAVTVWPDPDSVTVWTGEDWFTATVMPVAFGRWGVAACRAPAPRRAGPLDLVGRERTREQARASSHQLAKQVLAENVLRGARGPAVLFGGR